MPGGTANIDGWCFIDASAISCSNMTTERDCMDTFYCWWQFNDWNDPSQGGVCNDPDYFGYDDSDSFFVGDNPGCYLFDGNSTKCNYMLGCTYSGSQCIVDTGSANAGDIESNGLQCGYINDSNLCNNIGALSSCCEWKAGNCTENKFSQSCYENVDKFLDDVGLDACGDVAMKTSDEESILHLTA